MNDTPRYAIYYAPPPGSALSDFGAGVLGYDATNGVDVPFAAQLTQEFPQWRRHVDEPSRYGFHATLKAPFSLAPGFEEEDLVEAAVALAGHLVPASLGVLEVASMHRFVALLPRERDAGGVLAGNLVAAFEHLRAPLTEADRARRLVGPLSPRQISLLDRWGYPYVMEEFRFHMTLAGPLERELLVPACDALERLYANMLDEVEIDAISIFKQQTRSHRFVQMERVRLTGATAV